MAISLILSLIVCLTLACALLMGFKLYRQPSEPLSFLTYVKLIVSGIIAFIADTLGVGSFAVNVALAKLLSTFADEELPAMNNGAQVIPGMLSAFFFMKIVDVDTLTMIMLVAGTALGGLIGGHVVSRLSKQAVRGSMILCFALLIILLASRQLHLLPINGNLLELRGTGLMLGFIGMTLCGALTSAGVGLFVMVQSVLFLLNVSPLIAFPIMTAAGAVQQPITTMVFLSEDKVPLKKTLILSLSGCLGVFLGLQIFSYLTTNHLYSLLLLILLYNFVAMSRSYSLHKKRTFSLTPESAGNT